MIPIKAWSEDNLKLMTNYSFNYWIKYLNHAERTAVTYYTPGAWWQWVLEFQNSCAKNIFSFCAKIMLSEFYYFELCFVGIEEFCAKNDSVLNQNLWPPGPCYTLHALAFLIPNYLITDWQVVWSEKDHGKVDIHSMRFEWYPWRRALTASENWLLISWSTIY